MSDECKRTITYPNGTTAHCSRKQHIGCPICEWVMDDPQPTKPTEPTEPTEPPATEPTNEDEKDRL